MSVKDQQLFARREFSASMVEALRQGVEGWTREYTIERQDWPFKLEDIHAPTVLVFHGEEDRGVHPGIAEYMSMRIPSCNESKIYPDEGHSVVYFRYEEIIQTMLKTWE
jgi:pimeloyl-ACP methyl ester carboxylesterase